MALPNPCRTVITGAATGLGREFALAIARQGGHVICADIRVDEAEQTAQRLRRLGAKASVIECDVTDPDAVERLAEFATATLGEVDLLINNAGIAVAGAVGTVPLEDWRAVIDVNLWGVIYGCRTFTPLMIAQGHGAIINVASAAGLLSPPLLAPYNVTKAGVIALSETLHSELYEHGIAVTVLCPTFFQTELLDHSPDRSDEIEKFSDTVHTLMTRSKVQAPEVALQALAAVGSGQLYAVPMRDGRAFWRLKRLAPGAVPAITRAYRKYILKR